MTHFLEPLVRICVYNDDMKPLLLVLALVVPMMANPILRSEGPISVQVEKVALAEVPFYQFVGYSINVTAMSQAQGVKVTSIMLTLICRRPNGDLEVRTAEIPRGPQPRARLTAVGVTTAFWFGENIEPILIIVSDGYGRYVFSLVEPVR